MKQVEHVARMGDRRGAYRVLVGGPREGGHLEDLGIGCSIVLKWIFKMWDGTDMDWIALTQDKDRWWELVNAVMNLRVPYNAVVSSLDENVLASQERLCSMDLVSYLVS